MDVWEVQSPSGLILGAERRALCPNTSYKDAYSSYV